MYHLGSPLILPLTVVPREQNAPRGLIQTQLETIDFRELWMRSAPAGPSTAGQWQSRLFVIS